MKLFAGLVSEVARRVKNAFVVLFGGQEALAEPHIKRIQELTRAINNLISERDYLTKERDFAVHSMHLVASDALKHISRLEEALAKQKQKNEYDLLSGFRSPKDDLPN